jgi:hypothetical protein
MCQNAVVANRLVCFISIRHEGGIRGGQSALGRALCQSAREGRRYSTAAGMGPAFGARHARTTLATFRSAKISLFTNRTLPALPWPLLKNTDARCFLWGEGCLLEVVAAVDDLTALHSYELYRHRDANNPGIDRHRVVPE